MICTWYVFFTPSIPGSWYQNIVPVSPLSLPTSGLTLWFFRVPSDNVQLKYLTHSQLQQEENPNRNQTEGASCALWLHFDRFLKQNRKVIIPLLSPPQKKTGTIHCFFRAFVSLRLKTVVLCCSTCGNKIASGIGTHQKKLYASY